MPQNERVKHLSAILEKIPTTFVEQLDLSQKEIIAKYMDVFHIGSYFYIIFNTQAGIFEFVSPEIKDVLGYDPEGFDLSLILGIIHEEDLPLFYRYQEKAVQFYSQLPNEMFFKYKFSYDYRVLTHQKSYKRILQQVAPIYYFPEGGARTLTIFTDVSHLNIQGPSKLSFIGMDGAPSYYNVPAEEHLLSADKIFTKREQEILRYIIRNKTSQEIADLLCISKHTVQTHRKNIIRKSDCSSMQDLLVKSVREGWI